MIPMTQSELEELVAELRAMAEAAPMQSVRRELLHLAERYSAKAVAGRRVAMRRAPVELRPSQA